MADRNAQLRKELEALRKRKEAAKMNQQVQKPISIGAEPQRIEKAINIGAQPAAAVSPSFKGKGAASGIASAMGSGSGAEGAVQGGMAAGPAGAIAGAALGTAKGLAKQSAKRRELNAQSIREQGDIIQDTAASKNKALQNIMQGLRDAFIF